MVMERRRGFYGSGTPRESEPRVRLFWILCVLFVALMIMRLATVQLFQHGFYAALASGQHELFQELIPERGDIFIHDLKDRTLVSVATDRAMANLYADPRAVENPQTTTLLLADVLGLDAADADALEEKLSKKSDPYEPIMEHVTDALLEKVLALKLSGIHFVRELVRAYPEPGMGGHVLGFVGSDTEGNLAGKYGIEGHFQFELGGTAGFLRSEKDVAGRIIAVGERALEPAVDGADIVLTLDRTIQFVACDALRKTVERHQADGGSVVILAPDTGRVLAMCGQPDFDPNAYGEVEGVWEYNNPVIFAAYEPGSVLKPMTLAAAVDSGSVSPTTTYEDVGFVEIAGHTIKNADEKVYGMQTMTQALEQSINSGMIFAMRATGKERFVQYFKNFGLGMPTGIELDTESAGNITPLDEAGEIYAATASFGQGLTVTPLQIAAAYGVIANGGMLKKPYLVDEIRFADGRVQKTYPVDVRRVLDPKTSSLVGAMLVSVIEHGHGKRAGVDGYYIAGKTGTAQVPKKDGKGYEEDTTIGSFAGFGPVEDPKFVMVVRVDHPRTVPWAESTAAPLFGEIAEFLLQYFEVAPTRL